MNENEEQYRLTPKGFIYSSLGESTGDRFLMELKKYMERTDTNAIILDDKELFFETVAKEWDSE